MLRSIVTRARILVLAANTRYNFNDSDTTKIDPEDIVTPASYLLLLLHKRPFLCQFGSPIFITSV